MQKLRNTKKKQKSLKYMHRRRISGQWHRLVSSSIGANFPYFKDSPNHISQNNTKKQNKTKTTTPKEKCDVYKATI